MTRQRTLSKLPWWRQSWKRPNQVVPKSSRFNQSPRGLPRDLRWQILLHLRWLMLGMAWGDRTAPLRNSMPLKPQFPHQKMSMSEFHLAQVFLKALLERIHRRYLKYQRMLLLMLLQIPTPVKCLSMLRCSLLGRMGEMQGWLERSQKPHTLYLLWGGGEAEVLQSQLGEVEHGSGEDAVPQDTMPPPLYVPERKRPRDIYETQSLPPPVLSDKAIYCRLSRVFKPKMTGEYMVDEKWVKAWQDVKDGRSSLYSMFEKVAYSVDRGLAKTPGYCCVLKYQFNGNSASSHIKF